MLREVKKSASADGGPHSRVRARGTLHSAPPSALAEILWHACLQSRFHQISPIFGQNRVYLGCRGDSPNIFFIRFLIFLLLRSLQNSKTLAQTLLGDTAHFGFCPPKIGLGGLGGSPKIYFHWNPNIFST